MGLEGTLKITQFIALIGQKRRRQPQTHYWWTWKNSALLTCSPFSPARECPRAGKPCWKSFSSSHLWSCPSWSWFFSLFPFLIKHLSTYHEDSLLSLNSAPCDRRDTLTAFCHIRSWAKSSNLQAPSGWKPDMLPEKLRRKLCALVGQRPVFWKFRRKPGPFKVQKAKTNTFHCFKTYERSLMYNHPGQK